VREEDAVTNDPSLSIAAKLLEYPSPGLAEQARAAAEWLDVGMPDAAALTRRFADALSSMSQGALEEAYTAAFDFASLGTVYAGEHLFGPTPSRASFLARLHVLRRENGLAPGDELPDHVAELLRLAAAMRPGEERDELLRDAVLPTARAALAQLQPSNHPFAHAVAAAIAVVETVAGTASVEPSPIVPLKRMGDPSLSEPRNGHADEPELFEPSPEVTR
jgi:nitrate reductase delta subunit